MASAAFAVYSIYGNRCIQYLGTDNAVKFQITARAGNLENGTCLDNGFGQMESELHGKIFSVWTNNNLIV